MYQSTVAILLAIFCSASVSLMAQQNDTKVRTVIMQSSEKTISVNGKEIPMNEADGTFIISADHMALINDIDTLKEQSYSDVNVSVSIDKYGDKTVRKVKMSLKGNGKKEKLKWTDDGVNIPAEIQTRIDELGIDIDEYLGDDAADEQQSSSRTTTQSEKTMEIQIDTDEADQYDRISVEVEDNGEGNSRKRSVLIELMDDGKKEIIEWEDNGVIPDDIEELLQKKGISVDILEDSGME